MTIPSNNLLVKNLVEYGLSDKEAKMYLALLELEVGTVNEAAKASGVNRSSAYVVLEALKEKGLVSVSHDKKVQHYIATSPEALLYSAESQAQKQETVKNKIADIVPELKALHKDTKQRPKIQVFEGKQGLIVAFEDSLRNKEKLMRVSSSVGNLFKIMPEYFEGYVMKRIQKGVKMLGIHPYDEAAKRLVENSPKLDEAMLIPKEKYSFPADFTVYDNKIGFMSSDKGGWALIIESKEMAEVMKNLFDLAFEEAKRLGKSRKEKVSSKIST